MAEGKSVISKEALIRCIAVGRNIMNNPQYFINNGLLNEYTRDEVKEAEDIIKHLGGGKDCMTIEDFVNAVTSDVPLNEN
jgi:hypothetical protein